MGYRNDCHCSQCDAVREGMVRGMPIHILAAEILRQTSKEKGDDD